MTFARVLILAFRVLQLNDLYLHQRTKASSIWETIMIGSSLETFFLDILFLVDLLPTVAIPASAPGEFLPTPLHTQLPSIPP